MRAGRQAGASGREGGGGPLLRDSGRTEPSRVGRGQRGGHLGPLLLLMGAFLPLL